MKMIQPSPDAVAFVFEDEEEADESFDEFCHDDDRRRNVHITRASPRVSHHQHQSRVLKAQNKTSDVLVAAPYLEVREKVEELEKSS